MSYWLTLAERADRRANIAPAQSVVSQFTLALEERLQCAASGAVRYKRLTDTCLMLPVPLDAALPTQQPDSGSLAFVAVVVVAVLLCCLLCDEFLLFFFDCF